MAVATKGKIEKFQLWSFWTSWDVLSSKYSLRSFIYLSIHSPKKNQINPEENKINSFSEIFFCSCKRKHAIKFRPKCIKKTVEKERENEKVLKLFISFALSFCFDMLGGKKGKPSPRKKKVKAHGVYWNFLIKKFWCN